MSIPARTAPIRPLYHLMRTLIITNLSSSLIYRTLRSTSTHIKLSAPPPPKRARLHSAAMATSPLQDRFPHSDFGNFELLQSVDVNYAPLRVGKWRSRKTGLSVVVGSHDTPITNGHFTIASEIFDDTGRPHTLEHLVFMGSKQYPYKGVLDQLANRAGSSGTNAWTANDHTAYTIATAGTKGFLRMLPIYIDHILHPTITDASFTTEVYHITGKGEDAGVVYSEMQARENQAGDLMALAAQRMLYPKSSAYRSETGGLMSALRVLTAQQIREYHKQYYVPQNLCLIVDGAVDLAEFFAVLNESVETNIAAADPSWKRPFVDSTTSQKLSISKSQTKVIKFIEEDESMGDLQINWLGPSPNDYKMNTAISLLGSYLTSSATAPLQKEFVEVAKPYCTGISFSSEDRVNKNELSCFIADVPIKHIDSMRDLLVNKLKRILDAEGVDMKRMAMVISMEKRRLLNAMETSVSSALTDCAIGDFLYGDVEGTDLPKAFDDLAIYKLLEGWKASDWKNLLKKTFISQPCVTTIGKPSAALAAKIEKEEQERVTRRRQDYGEEKLKQLDRKIEEAKAEADRPPPPGMITDFPMTNPKTLVWIPVQTGVNDARGSSVSTDKGPLQTMLDDERISLPYQAHFTHVESNFVTVSALFDTISVPADLKPYFSIIQGAFFCSAIKRQDGSILPYEMVVDLLDDFTVHQSANFSFRGRFSEVFTVELKVETSNYEKAVSWIRDLVTGLVFEKERLLVIVAKMLQELPYEKRDGAKVADAYLYQLAFDLNKSTSEACSLLNILEFVPKILQQLESDDDDVIRKLEAARRHLLEPANMRLSVRGNILGLQTPKAVLQRSFIPVKDALPLNLISRSSETLTALGAKPSKQCIMVTMPAIEGSYAAFFAKGLDGFDHPDLPALTLAVSTLNAAESYLWKAIRGAGLAYGAHVSASAESGLCSYTVYRSSNAKLAYEEAKTVLQGIVNGVVELDQDIIDGARQSLTYSYARASETVGAAAGTAYSDEVLKGVGKDFNQKMLERLPAVTLKDVRGAIEKYLLPIFSSDTAIGAVAVSSVKAQEVEAGFKSLSFNVERRQLPALEEDNESDEGDDSDATSTEASKTSGTTLEKAFQYSLSRDNLEQEVGQVMGTLGSWWGGVKKQAVSAATSLKADLDKTVIQAQADLQQLKSAKVEVIRKESDDDSAPLLDMLASSTSQMQYDLQSAFRSTLTAAANNPTLQNAAEFRTHLAENLKMSSAKENLQITMKQAEKLAEEYMKRGESLRKDAGKWVNDAVKVVPPSSGKEASSLSWDGSDWYAFIAAPQGSSSSSNSNILFDARDGSRRSAQRNIPLSRKDAMLARLRQDEKILLIDPEKEYSKLYEAYLRDKWDQQKIMGKAEDSGLVGAIRMALVPEQITDEQFWQRYLFNKDLIIVEDEKRQKLLQATAEPQMDDFSWDDETDDPSLKPIATETEIVSATPKQSLEDRLPEHKQPKKAISTTTSPRNSSEGSYDVVSEQSAKPSQAPSTAGKSEDEDSDWE